MNKNIVSKTKRRDAKNQNNAISKLRYIAFFDNLPNYAFLIYDDFYQIAPFCLLV